MKKTRFNQEWNFWKEGYENAKQVISLPHDAMLMEKRDPDLINGSATGFYPGGKYFYSKILYGEVSYANQSVMLEFEGVYMNSTVFLNGEKVGGWIYGYTNFFVDLTGKIKIEEDNELLVEVDNSKNLNSRWYSGSGIYRPVNLWIGGNVHINPQGFLVKTISYEPAVIQIRTDCDGIHDAEERISVEYTIYDGEMLVASAVGNCVEVEIPDAKLWSAETPHLYKVKAIMKDREVPVDEAEVRFGIRTLSWSTGKGLQVNGETVKLRGGCIHHDNGILGACTYDKAEYRKMKKLKEFGFNAIRCAHNPVGETLLDVCDELGMYVMDETFDMWRRPKLEGDYSNYFDMESGKDIAALARRDYNHPSVIMYCIGNEIGDTGRSYAPEVARNLCSTLKEIDDTRPTTIANNAIISMFGAAIEKLEGERGTKFGSQEVNELITANPNFSNIFKEEAFSASKLEELVGPVFDELDIAGHNYAHEIYSGINELRPDRILLSAETLPRRMAENWKWVEENDHIIGDFHWTAWDYLGEAGIGLPLYGTTEAPFAKPYPCLAATCGSFDLIGFPEAAAYYTAIIWGVYMKPYIAVRPVYHSEEPYTLGGWRLTDAINCWTWNGCDGKKAEIFVYSIGKYVSLFQNGTLVAQKDLVDFRAEFETVYQEGALEAISYDENGNEMARSVLRTNGNGVRLAISPDETEVKTDPNEIIYVSISVTDEEGNVRMTTDKKISVTVEGEGTLLALGSGRPETEESFLDGSYTSWHGQVLAVVSCTGKTGLIKITAAADNCEDVSTFVKVC